MLVLEKEVSNIHESKLVREILQTHFNKTQKIDWKEWLPLIGIGFAFKDAFYMKPTILTKPGLSKRFLIRTAFLLKGNDLIGDEASI
jgi:hypothetical protein